MPKKKGVIDKTDKKILRELDDDARQTDKQIASTIGTSRQVVNYRIKKLRENGVITSFYTNINVGKLQLNTYYVYLQLSGVNKEQEQSLLQTLQSLDFVGWLVSGVGRWDAVALIFAPSSAVFEELLSRVMNECGDHLHEYSFTTLVEAEHISYKFLSDDSSRAKQTEKQENVSLDDTEIKILDEVSQNARAKVSEVARATEIEPHIVRYRLNKLKDTIIEGFKPKIDVNKLGFQWHLLLITFQTFTEQRKQAFITYCKNHPNVYYVTNTLGTYNVMLDIHVEDTEAFKDVLFDLKEKFSDLIKLYESMIIFEEHEISYFPTSLITS